MPFCKALLTILVLATGLAKPLALDRPNVIYILADDLGYGDLSHAGGKVPTPHCDRLAREGMRFTDSHTTSSTLTKVAAVVASATVCDRAPGRAPNLQ